MIKLLKEKKNVKVLHRTMYTNSNITTLKESRSSSTEVSSVTDVRTQASIEMEAAGYRQINNGGFLRLPWNRDWGILWNYCFKE